MAIIIPSKKIYELNHSILNNNVISSVEGQIQKYKEEIKYGNVFTELVDVSGLATYPEINTEMSIAEYPFANSDYDNNISYGQIFSGSTYLGNRIAQALVKPIYYDCTINLKTSVSESSYIADTIDVEVQKTIEKRERAATIWYKTPNKATPKVDYINTFADYEYFSSLSYEELETLRAHGNYPTRWELAPPQRVDSIPLEGYLANKGEDSTDVSWDIDAPTFDGNVILGNNASNLRIISREEENDNVVSLTFKLKILCGLILIESAGYSYIPVDGSPLKNVIKGKITEYRPIDITINLLGTTYTLVGEETAYVVSGSASNGIAFYVSSNNLIQEKPSISVNQIATRYKNGKETATIRCSIGEYYDEKGNLAISTKTQDKMTFDIGDKVVPMVRNGNGVDDALSYNKIGVPKAFEVVGTKLINDGAVWQELTLREQGTASVALPLYAPIISLENQRYIRIENIDERATSCVVYANGVALGNVAIAQGETYALFELPLDTLTYGDYNITAKVMADGYYDSDYSNIISYVYAQALSAPQISIDGNDLNIVDTSGKAQSYDVYIGGEHKVTVKATTNSNLKTSINLQNYIAIEGVYIIYVYAWADGYNQSPKSNEVSYIYSIPKGSLAYQLAGGGTYYICSGIGTETRSDITIDSAYNGLPVREIKRTAFNSETSITSVTVSEGIVKIGDYAFSDCTSLENIYLPTTLEDLSGFRIFYSCTSLKKLVLKETSITELGSHICFGCYNLSQVTLPSTLTHIGERAFAYCQITSITIPDSVTSISVGAFDGCSQLASVQLSSNLNGIPNYAFRNCSKLLQIRLPNAITYINGDAFAGCTSLKTIIFNGTVEQWNAISKISSWHNDVPATYVTCSDGTVNL
jgi:hypothetical protein